MNLATEQFKLPFESGEPIMKKIDYLTFKATFDKAFILSSDDFLARGEVAHMALRNEHFVKSQQSRNMSWAATTINYNKAYGKIPSGPIPECFGIFMGKFIPFAANMGISAPWENMTMNDVTEGTKLWTGQFFENYCDFWCLVFINEQYPDQAIKSLSNKPVWVRFSKLQMVEMWHDRYVFLKQKGLQPCIDYEISYQNRTPDEVEMWNAKSLFPK